MNIKFFGHKIMRSSHKASFLQMDYHTSIISDKWKGIEIWEDRNFKQIFVVNWKK
jgi:hypothetical protein